MDIELIVGPVSEPTPEWLRFVGKLYVVDRMESEGDSFIRISYSGNDVVQAKGTVGDEILKFLTGLKSFEMEVKHIGGELRLGIYYDVPQTVVFPLYLSIDCVRALERFGVALDSTGYPCGAD